MVNDTTIMNTVDLFKTFCNLVGADVPDTDFDGQDMSQALLGNPQDREESLFWEYGREDFYLSPGNPRFRSPNLTVRDGKWKLLINADSTDIELYDLTQDYAETKNLKDEYPSVARRLAMKVLTWRRSLP